MQRNLHENFERLEAARLPSDRSFGLVFAAIFLLIGVAPTLHGGSVRPFGITLSIAFLLITWLAPAALHRLNVLWTRFGVALARITNPLVCGLLFFLVFAPLGLVLRALGKINMHGDPATGSGSQWIPRSPTGSDRLDMRNQF